MIKFNCPKCNQEVIFKWLKEGEIGKCPHCGSNITDSENSCAIPETHTKAKFLHDFFNRPRLLAGALKILIILNGIMMGLIIMAAVIRGIVSGWKSSTTAWMIIYFVFLGLFMLIVLPTDNIRLTFRKKSRSKPGESIDTPLLISTFLDIVVLIAFIFLLLSALLMFIFCLHKEFSFH